MREKSLFQRIASLALAVAMVCSILVVMPEKTQAADFSFNSTSSVNIPDGQDTRTTGEYAWIKYKAPADGYLTVKANYASSVYTASEGYWQLFDSARKTALSGNDTYSTNYDAAYQFSNVFGMKKGKTYNLRVYSLDGVTISSKFTKVSEKSGKSKTKAVSIKKGKTIKGIIPAGDKQADWYKFKVTKKQYLKLSWSAKTNDLMKFTVYEGSKNIGTVKANYASSKTYSQYVTNLYTNKKLKVDPATFYVKIERATKTSSGYYTFKWN